MKFPLNLFSVSSDKTKYKLYLSFKTLGASWFVCCVGLSVDWLILDVEGTVFSPNHEAPKVLNDKYNLYFVLSDDTENTVDSEFENCIAQVRFLEKLEQSRIRSGI
jgi:hypothetical protein